MKTTIKRIIQKFSTKIEKGTNKRKLKKISHLFSDKKGLEIGGPSPIFNASKWFPVYKMMSGCDGINFANKTIFTDDIVEQDGYIVENVRRGNIYIIDAADLSTIPAETYDFILSSHNIEHIANPLKAIEGWLKKLTKEGLLVIVAPRKDENFDRNRKTVHFDHLEQDYKNQIEETDMTHLEEILEKHDLSKDPWAGTAENFKNRCLNNIEYRAMHHHVFDNEVLKKVYDYLGLTIIANLRFRREYVIIGRKDEQAK